MNRDEGLQLVLGKALLLGQAVDLPLEVALAGSRIRVPCLEVGPYVLLLHDHEPEGLQILSRALGVRDIPCTLATRLASGVRRHEDVLHVVVVVSCVVAVEVHVEVVVVVEVELVWASQRRHIQGNPDRRD